MSESGSHECPALGCEVQVPHHMLACRAHWFSIPKPLRDALWAAYDDGEGMGTERHDQAVRACCEYLKQAA